MTGEKNNNSLEQTCSPLLVVNVLRYVSTYLLTACIVVGEVEELPELGGPLTITYPRKQ
jgi:hypothetical protein